VNIKNKNKPAPFFRAAMQGDGTLEMLCYGEIIDSVTLSMLESYGYDTTGFISAAAVKKQIDTAGNFSKVRVRINSPGGDAFEGIAIHNLLRAQGKPIETCIDGVAASSASIIAMAGDTRTIGNNAMMMIHNAWSCCCGNAADMRKLADTLDKISGSIAQTYVDRSGMTAEEITALMDDETWMSADDCVKNKFCTAIADPPAEQSAKAMALAQRFEALGKLKKPPKDFQTAMAAMAADACACDCEDCMDGDCPSCSNKECDDANCEDCPMQSGTGNSADVKPEAAASNLSLYEARLKMLGKR
jgi:ATP-dependent protease ClpP protease subunit